MGLRHVIIAGLIGLSPLVAMAQTPLPITLSPSDLGQLYKMLGQIRVNDATEVYNPITQFLNAKEQEAQIAALKAKAEAEAKQKPTSPKQLKEPQKT